MRCLYCNKKLSLLKLAKGDSFCSPAHFDAHQLQLSKDAFQRLMSLPDEDTPKAPLVRKPKDDKPVEITPLEAAPQEDAPPVHSESEEKAAFARLAGSAYRPPERKEKVPPYAPFARSPLPAFSPDPHSQMANGPQVNEPVEAARALAFPVHEVEATICILNLYLRLSLAGTRPKNWTSERHLIVTPEYFNLKVSQPSIEFTADFPEVEEATAPAEIPAPVETLAQIEMPAPVEATSPVEMPARVEEVPAVEPEIPAQPAVIIPLEIPQSRVPYLVAPSFLERRGTILRLDNDASAVPSDSTVAPILDQGRGILDSCSTIPSCLQFVGNPLFRPQDSSMRRIASGPGRPVNPTFVLPQQKKLSCQDAWPVSTSHLGIARPALEARREPARPIGFEAPVPDSLVVRPDAVPPSKVDPQQFLSGISTTSLFRGALEARPFGQQPLAADLPAIASEAGWRVALARWSPQEPLSDPWKPADFHRSLPQQIAAGIVSFPFPIEAALNSLACCKPEKVKTFSLPELFVAKDLYRPTEWPSANFTFAAAPGSAGWVLEGSTVYPGAADLPSVGFRIRSDSPVLKWAPTQPAPKSSPAAKSLPTRDSAIMPHTQDWERLDALPR